MPADSIRSRVRVVLNPPPCERSFSSTFRPNGELKSVEIDGAYYACRRRKRDVRWFAQDRHLPLVEVVIAVD